MERREKRRWILELISMGTGAALALTSVLAAFHFCTKADYLAAGIMVSPSVFVILKLMILRHSEPKDAKAAGAALGAATQLPPPQL
jgi:mannitol-specific phosphotransferase system IIBC component